MVVLCFSWKSRVFFIKLITPLIVRCSMFLGSKKVATFCSFLLLVSVTSSEASRGIQSQNLQTYQQSINPKEVILRDGKLPETTLKKGTVEYFIWKKMVELKRAGNKLGFELHEFEGEGAVVPELTEEVLEKVWEIVSEHHLGQRRDDASWEERDQGIEGSDYRVHILGVVATAVNQLKVIDPLAVIALFLHDSIEDSIYNYLSDENIDQRLDFATAEEIRFVKFAEL